MLLVGTAKRLEFELRNLAGALSNGTVSFTAVKPDGTAVTPAPTVQNDGTGLYHVDLTVDQAGRWTWVFTSTGAVVVTDAGILDVASTSSGFIISLEAAKQQLNIEPDDFTQDEELESFIAAATAVVEHHTGPIAKAVRTERHFVWGDSVVLDTDVAAVPTEFTGISTGATTIDVADLMVSNGIVRRKDGGLLGSGTFDITYVAGRSDVPPAVGLACRTILQHLWSTQRGGSRSARGGQDTSTVLGYAVPNRALELLATQPSGTGGFA